MTIHCVTPNPAVDVTYQVDAVELHGVNRVGQVTQRPGGKGVNVARLLAARGAEVATYGFLGGSAGDLLEHLLREAQPAIRQRWTTTAGETRRTVAVVDRHDTTMFNEAGLPVTDDEWTALAGTLLAECRPGDVVTISGSLPPGSDPENLARLVAGGRERGAVLVVDTSGPGLLLAARAGADVVKPNQHELLDVTGAGDIDEGIDLLLGAGCRAVVASLGADGLVLGTRAGRLRAGLGRVLTGNPTGAGDALVAALAHGLATSADPDPLARLAQALPAGVAWSAAAVLSPVAGEIDQTVADQLTREVTTKEA